MRIRRLKVRHLRGVDAAELVLPPRGVVVVQGPNEAGKSSLADAIDVLFDDLHTTTRQVVRDLQPVGRDVGTEIEVEATCGPWHFTYAKRYHRDREAVLHLHAPETAAFAGRAAHERMERLLASELDVDLWRALRLAQGTSLQQADLRKAPSLVEALDRVAGTGAGDGHEEGLFAQVCATHQQYFTPTGRDGAGLRQADGAVAAARAEVEQLTAELRRLDHDVDQAEALEASATAARGALEAARREAAAQAGRRAQLEELQAEQARLESARALALARRAAAQRDRERRAHLQRESAALTEHASALAEERSEVADRLTAAEAARAAAEPDAAAAQAGLASAEQRCQRTAEALARARDRAEVEQLRARLAQADAGRDQVVGAQAALAAIPVDEATVAGLRAARDEVHQAEAARNASSPRVELLAESPASVLIDGAPIALDPARAHVHTATEPVEVVVGGVTMRVSRGAGTAELATAAQAAIDALERRLTAAGVATVAEAEAALDRRRQAERTLAASQAAAAAAGDPEPLRAGVQALEARLAVGGASPPARGGDDLMVLEAEQERAAAQLEAARGEVGSAAEALRQAGEQVGALAERRDRLAAEAARLTAQQARTAEALDDCGRGDDGGALAVAEDAAAREVDRLEVALGAVARALLRADDATVGALADDAEVRVRTLERELRQLEDALLDVRARLAVTGESGVFEAHAAALADLDAAERDRDGLRRRAQAARVLHDTMRSCRDTARRTYAGPLREQVRALARLVLDDDAEVALDDETLAVTALERDGVRLPFEALSAGTREQLGVIGRLATAMVVAGDGGVPVILDDALGYADPGRLEAMGEVLALAGRTCQVIVLTCVPDRYCHVSNATVLSLG